ncbi:MAG: glycosyltransferase family 2 protein, partial [Bacteroides sp.]
MYNGEQCVEQCVASLTTQSFDDFEILCVDDASSDGSSVILSRLGEEDHRIRVICLEQNGGCSRARRRGVLSSKGDYVLFADQDDTYALGALQRLYDELAADPVDVLAFDADVESVDGVGDDEVRGVREWMRAPQVRLLGRHVLDACFLDNEYGYSLWNKAYRGDMARTAFAATEDETVPLGEDNYAYFVLAY